MTLNKLISKIALKIDPPEPPRTTGNWVMGLNGQLVWDPWDFPEPTEEEAAATLSSLSQTARWYGGEGAGKTWL
jgi:hypothetical protein